MVVKDTFFENKKNINCRGKLIDLSTPVVMGILNVTPDSFYDGGKYQSINDVHKHVDQLISEGAMIIDVGAVSTRPGAKIPEIKEEIARLIPVLDLIRKNYPEVIISIDTFRSDVAKIAVYDYGADMINDVSAGSMDEKMFETIADLQVPYIMMHMKGTPENMQNNPVYENVVQEVVRYFADKTNQLKQLGIHDVIIDPGFGFGKTVEHNFELLSKLDQFKIFELPVMVGLSRKSMITKTLGCKPEDALNGTTALNAIALKNGASILRVHDVKEAVEIIKLFAKL